MCLAGAVLLRWCWCYAECCGGINGGISYRVALLQAGFSFLILQPTFSKNYMECFLFLLWNV